MITYCNHRWEQRTVVLRAVFPRRTERDVEEYLVCRRCLRIREHREVPRPMPDDDARAA